jgi:hypothetical protein
MSFKKGAILKGLRRRLFHPGRSQPLQGCELNKCASLSPGFQSKRSHPTRAARAGTPAWAGISERFQRKQSK